MTGQTQEDIVSLDSRDDVTTDSAKIRKGNNMNHAIHP